jgi:hypothetical protein
MSEFDDERARGRAAILKRRAQLVAYAVAAGVAMPACGGKSSYCLGIAVDGGRNSGGTPTSAGTYACLSAAGSQIGGYGGTYACLSVAGSGIGGYVCLGMPYAGESFGGTGGQAGEASGGGQSEGGAGGEGPIFCLSAPLAGAPPIDTGGGESGGGQGGAG